MIRLTPFAPAAGSVLQTTMIMSQFRPLLMKVLLPLMTYSSPSRTAVVRIAFRSLPPPGSVMAMARIVSPRQISGSHCCFCSSVPRRTMYGAMMSECRPTGRTRDARAVQLFGEHAAWPKSPPPPPYSAGRVAHSRPSRPAFSQVSRSTAGLVPFGLARQAFALEEAARGLAQHFMVFAVDGTVDVHGGSLSCG